jgi:hypothetical protein
MTPGLLTQMGTVATHTRSAKKYETVNYDLKKNTCMSKIHAFTAEHQKRQIVDGTHHPVEVKVIPME